jgi:hypothetical protein
VRVPSAARASGSYGRGDWPALLNPGLAQIIRSAKFAERWTHLPPLSALFNLLPRAHLVFWSLGLAGGPLLLPGIPGCPGLPPAAGAVDGFTLVPVAGPLLSMGTFLLPDIPGSPGFAAAGPFVCATIVASAGPLEFPIGPAKAGEPRSKAAASIWGMRRFVMLNSIKRHIPFNEFIVGQVP